MRESLLIRLVFFFFCFLFIVCPCGLQASEIESLPQAIKPFETVEAPIQMTEKQMTVEQMNELLGEDPYLGQTSYLQSPDGFSKRGK